jgi:hypothetical protein
MTTKYKAGPHPKMTTPSRKAANRLQLAALLITVLLGVGLPDGATAQAPDQQAALKQYLAMRDAFQKRVPKWPSDSQIDWKPLMKSEDSLRHLLAPLAISAVGRFDVPGLAQPGVYNVETLLPGDEDSFLADGVRFRSRDSTIKIFVSTPELIRWWDHGKDPVKTLSAFGPLNRIFPVDAGVTPYAMIPVPGKGVLIAFLMARQQDYGPNEFADELMLSFVRARQLVVVEAPSPVVVHAPPPCRTQGWKMMKADQLNPPETPAESVFRYPFGEDALYRICYSREVVKDPAWPKIVARANELAAMILK